MSETLADQGQLFDPDEFGPGRKPRAARVKPDLPVEPLAPGYTYMRDSQGVMPYAHLIAGWNSAGATVTLCGRAGTKITNAGVEVMIRCPGCDIAQQLQ
jgi:hypothetical protein